MPEDHGRPQEAAGAAAAACRWWLYLLVCRDGRSYAGIARDVQARFAAHVRGKGAKFTRANPPLRVLGARPYATKSQALRAEYALKQLDPAAKRRWAARWQWRDTPSRLRDDASAHPASRPA
ncbi:hypothetical protein ACG33_05530 [Steroidobacter denitrificans]|uniref:GIY-YIG domain-containing protein n=1 Tax=Steroidobacter denitrificans TaxID=465721 RepID=A0A127F7Z4_STEDE|nr:hypothetical protein ACG33_05530 [Steroidobacter denitrificans]